MESGQLQDEVIVSLPECDGVGCTACSLLDRIADHFVVGGGIDTGGGDVRVAEELLDVRQGDAGPQHLHRPGVPQLVGMDPIGDARQPLEQRERFGVVIALVSDSSAGSTAGGTWRSEDDINGLPRSRRIDCRTSPG